MPGRDLTDHLTGIVTEAFEGGQPLDVQGASSKHFIGNPVAGRTVSTAGHQGIVAYEPTELVLTARSGTSVAELESTVAAEGQMLACEPPRLAEVSTVGGSIAAGLSGPARPFLGGVRDCVLGVKMLNGRGEQLSFGGSVVKNVAGFDVSRLLCGSMGCLGLLLELTLKLRPRARSTETLSFECTSQQAMARFSQWRRSGFPLTGAAWEEGRAWVRLSGPEQAVAQSRKLLGGQIEQDGFWQKLRDHKLEFFAAPTSLWLIRSKPSAELPALSGRWLLDWAGSLRWLATDETDARVLDAVARTGGFAWPYRTAQTGEARLIRESLLPIHRRLCEAFDPLGILNPGRLHPEL